jgi:hypothetical protein
VCLAQFAILVHIENGRLKRTVCVQFSLNWSQVYEPFEMLKVAFGEQIMGGTQVFE